MRDIFSRIFSSRISIVLFLILILAATFAAYRYFPRETIPQPEFVCGGRNCFGGCCVHGKCQLKGINIAGYTCLGENKWESPDKESISSGTPYAVIDAVTGKSPGPDKEDSAAIVATVGEERIFQKDVDSELLFYPPQYNPDVRKSLIEKISSDSNLLQKAAGEGVISLDETVYNSPDKDYQKRLSLVKEVKGIFDSRLSRLSGTIVSIWFYNEKIGPLGYQKSKEMAYGKIDALQRNVKKGTITMEEAIDIIKQDSELEQIDTSYESNASFRFDVREGEKISLDPGFDSNIWKLPEGEISDVYLVKDTPNVNSPPIDAVFMFAKIEDKKLAENSIKEP